MSFLLGIVEKGTPEKAQAMVHQVMDLLWLFMEVRFMTQALGQASGLPSSEGASGRVLEKSSCPRGCPGTVPFPPHPQDYEVQDCLKQLMMSLLRLYRFSPIVPDLSLQVGEHLALP